MHATASHHRTAEGSGPLRGDATAMRHPLATAHAAPAAASRPPCTAAFCPACRPVDEQCVVCGRPDAHFGRRGAAMHQACLAAVERMATSPMASDAELIAYCDRTPREHVLATRTQYVTTAMLEDALFGFGST